MVIDAQDLQRIVVHLVGEHERNFRDDEFAEFAQAGAEGAADQAADSWHPVNARNLWVELRRTAAAAVCCPGVQAKLYPPVAALPPVT